MSKPTTNISLKDLSKIFKQSTAVVRKNKKHITESKAALDAQERATIAEAEKLKQCGWDPFTETWIGNEKG